MIAMRKIVDIHVHPSLIRGDTSNYGAEEERLIDCMDRAGIAMANIMPLVREKGGSYHNPTEDDINQMAEFTRGMLKNRPGKFYSMLWLNPFLPISFLEGVIQRHILDGPINGVKILYELRVGDPQHEPLAKFMEKHNVPVLIHAWYNNMSPFPGESRPCDVAELARKFPGLRISMAHMRGARFRGIQDIKKHKNVRLDTCGSESEDGYLQYAVQELGENRVVYGSDYGGRDFSASIARIESLDAPQKTLDKIFGENAIDFLERGI